MTEKIRYICMNKNKKNHFIIIATIFHNMMDQQMCTEAFHAIHPFPLENIIHNRLTHSLAPTVLFFLLFRDQPESISNHNRNRYAIITNVHHH